MNAKQEFISRVLKAAEPGMIEEEGVGWVWYGGAGYRGAWTAAALRVVAEELERRNLALRKKP